MIRIITDSLSDMTQEEASNLDITVLPLFVIFDQECYLDGVTISHKAFYERLNQEGQLPTTSQVTPDCFYSAFEKAFTEGDEVLCICGSSEVSGTYQSATIARDMHEKKENIHVIDTLNITIGQRLAVMEAVRLREQGASMESIERSVKALLPRICMVGQVENLKHLVRGGRINNVSAQVGSMLHLKPTLRLKEGKILQDGMKRGRKSILAWFCQQLEDYKLDESYPIQIASADSDEMRDVLKQALLKYGIASTHLQESEIGSVLGTHSGSGCIAMAWVEQEK